MPFSFQICVNSESRKFLGLCANFRLQYKGNQQFMPPYNMQMQALATLASKYSVYYTYMFIEP